ncbi:alpha/beta fold hydrolase [Psychrobacillus sp. OK032]|uniref:intracellular short-chain-length polyhydroxyalkanoate depolymerase n=1 Tax=Psychrobacillus sp. OK032 TaxID=1884358 RepID=UPI0008B46B4A|nr:alpha/beta hydrolase [Psychrobacillus sp. OK032]SES11551.1 Pimeloyl-ACP methyl ester carboxylesterase [Psychrobacillus sp. OK032]
MSLPKVQLENGEQVSYRERPGGEEVVVLVHGNMTSSKHWDVLIDQLDAKYKVYAIDLRGFGESTYKTRVQGIKDFSDDLKGFVDALELKQFHLIGWSTGGAICMQFVADYPGYCKKLVLLASASTRGYPFFATNMVGSPNLSHRFKSIVDVENDLARTIPMQALYNTKNKAGLRAVWNASIYTHNRPKEEDYDAYLDDMLTQRNLADVYHSLNTFNISAVNNEAAKGTNQAKDITIPVLILRGDRDYVVTEEMTQEIVTDLGENATYIPLTNCGHSPLIDDLEQLTSRIENFISKENNEQ